MDSNNLVMLVEFEIYEESGLIVCNLRANLPGVNPCVGASLSKRAADRVFWGEFEAVTIRHLRLQVIPHHVANRCDATIAV